MTITDPFIMIGRIILFMLSVTVGLTIGVAIVAAWRWWTLRRNPGKSEQALWGDNWEDQL